MVGTGFRNRIYLVFVFQITSSDLGVRRVLPNWFTLVPLDLKTMSRCSLKENLPDWNKEARVKHWYNILVYGNCQNCGLGTEEEKEECENDKQYGTCL
mgnify:CR=1 FL=1